MPEADLTGAEQELPAPVLCPAVLTVSCDGSSRMSELHPDLVMSSGQEPDPHKASVLLLLQHFVGKLDRKSVV